MANAGCINAYDCNGCLIQTLQNLDSACIGVGVQYTAPNPLDDKRLDYIKYTDKCGCTCCLSGENEILIYATNGVIKNLTLTNDDVNEAIKIKWNDIFGSNRAKTIVRYKTGSYPVSITDGTLAVEETTKNQYSSTPFSLSGVLDETTYYITAFAVDSNNVVIGTQQTTITTSFGWHPSANTLARYKLTENANDYSGNGRNATAVNTTFSTTNGAYFRGYLSAGNNGRAETPSFTIGTTYTVNMRVKSQQTLSGTNGIDLHRRWLASSRYVLFYANGSGFHCMLGNGSTSQGSQIDASFNIGTSWHNVCFTRNGANISIYVDGTLLTSGNGGYTVAPNYFCFGNDASSGSDYTASSYFKDYILENKIRTATEVLEYYNKTKNHYA